MPFGQTTQLTPYGSETMPAGHGMHWPFWPIWPRPQAVVANVQLAL